MRSHTIIYVKEQDWSGPIRLFHGLREISGFSKFTHGFQDNTGGQMEIQSTGRGKTLERSNLK